MKVTVNYDTVTKQCEVMQDGAAVDMVEACCFYKSYYEEGKYSMELRQYDEDKEEGIRKLSSTLASLL